MKARAGPKQGHGEAENEPVAPPRPPHAEAPNPKSEGRLVIFVDELDTVRSLPFSTDEFFAAIRECYNRRTEDPNFHHLAFCLLGVAVPSDLIRDTRTTPFNIGRRIELNDFTRMEAAPLAGGLRPNHKFPASNFRSGEMLLERILYWTNGHPYLTQRLCHAVAEALQQGAAAGNPSPRLVDQLCDDLFLSSRAREQDDNLLFVRERILRSETDMVSVLDLYGRVLSQKKSIAYDETNPLMDTLRLSGIVRISGGYLSVRNRIYEWVFDRAWAVSNMPDAELRRQTRAYRQGLFRSAGIAAVILAVVSGLAFYAFDRSQVARMQTLRADLQTTIAKRNAKQSLERLVRLNVTTGVRHMEAGDLLGALPWFVEALNLEQGETNREETARIRIGCVLRQAPKLLQVWTHQGGVAFAGFSPDSRRVVTISADHTAQIWETASGQSAAPPWSHTNKVTFAEFSPDGQWVLTTSEDTTARVWDAFTGHPVTPPLAHQRGVLRGCFSPDGRFVATGSRDRTLRVWDARTGQLRFAPLQHGHNVHYVEFSPDGRRLLAACGDGTVWLRDAESGESVAPPLVHRGHVWQAVFSPDGRLVATASGDHTAQVWDAQTGRRVGAAMNHDSWVNTAAFSPDSRLVATASYDWSARVWEAQTGLPITQPLKHTHAVWRAAFSPDGRQVISASFDQSARVWNVATSELGLSPLRHNGSVYQAAFSPDGHKIITTSEDTSIRLWDIAVGLSTLPTMPHKQPINRVRFSRDGLRIVTACSDHTAAVWESATGKLIAVLPHDDAVNGAEFSLDGRWIATASTDATARVWDAATGQMLFSALSHTGKVYSAVFSPDGARIVTAGADGTAQVWSAATGQRILPPLRRQKTMRWAAFSPDGRKIVSASDDDAVCLWDALTGQLLPPPLQHEHPLHFVAFSPDGRNLVATCSDNTFEPRSALIWDTESGQPVSPPLQHGDGVLSAAFSPDGRHVVTTSEDSTASLWDAKTGKLITPPLKHRYQVHYAEFSADGRLLLTVSGDWMARVWDAATGEPVTGPLLHNSTVLHAAFSPDGHRLVTGTLGGTAHLWELPKDTRSVRELVLLTEVLTGQRIDPFAGSMPVGLDPLTKAWQTLRREYPVEFSSAPGQVTAWHRRELEDCVKRGQWAGAVFHLEPLVAAEPDQWQHRLRYAEACHALNQWTQSLENVSKAIELAPDKVESYELRAHLHDMHFGKPDLAIQDLLQVHRQKLETYAKRLAANPADVEARRERGQIHAAMKLWPEAAADFDAALLAFQSRDELAQLHMARAHVLVEINRHDRAVADLEKALELAPADARICDRLAWLLANGPRQYRQPAQALALAQRAVESDKFNLQYLKTLGMAYYRLGQFAAALETLENLSPHQRDGNTAFDLFLLAMTRFRLGQPEKAQESFTQAVAWWQAQSHLTRQQVVDLKALRAESESLLAGRQILD